MLEINIPGQPLLRLEHLVLDYNGTLACDGQLLDILPALRLLAKDLQIHILTADTYGTVAAQVASLGCQLHCLSPDRQSEGKLTYVNALGAQSCVAAGNGSIDSLMLSAAALGVAVVQQEGCSMRAVQAADILVNSIDDLFALLLKPQRLRATLRL